MKKKKKKLIMGLTLRILIFQCRLGTLLHIEWMTCFMFSTVYWCCNIGKSLWRLFLAFQTLQLVSPMPSIDYPGTRLFVGFFGYSNTRIIRSSTRVSLMIKPPFTDSLFHRKAYIKPIPINSRFILILIKHY